MNRSSFLGAVGAAPLAGAAIPLLGASHVRPVSVAAANVDYAAMMRHLGYARIDDKATGLTYHAGGLIERTRTVRRLAVARSVRPNTYCYDDCSPYEVANYFGVEDSAGYVVGYYDGKDPQPTQDGFQTYVATPFYAFSVTSPSSMYWIAAQKAAVHCLDQELAAGLFGSGIAKYVVANAPKFATNISAAGEQYLRQKALQLGDGPAFIAAVIASVPLSQWLLIATTVGVTALFAYSLWRCYTNAS